MRHDAVLSKFLSYILRHAPQDIGLSLDSEGWANIDDLIMQSRRSGKPEFDRSALDAVVATNPKQRFAISADGQRIRASQGHSIAIDHGYVPTTPPGVLFHGTYRSALPRILAEGLHKMERHHVHLSVDEKTAMTVGSRRGAPVLLRVDAAAMHQAGMLFLRSDNGVWLTDHVAPAYLTVV
jgi:putative RNA 2'-phosphotransferase